VLSQRALAKYAGVALVRLRKVDYPLGSNAVEAVSRAPPIFFCTQAGWIAPSLMEAIMHHNVEPPQTDDASGNPVSRRALLEGRPSAGFVAAVIAGGGSVLRSGDANAADPVPDGRPPRQLAGGQSARQMTAFRIRQAAAQACLNEQEPSHRSNGDEE